MPGVAGRRAIDLYGKCWGEVHSGFYRAVLVQRIPACRDARRAIHFGQPLGLLNFNMN
jgi:hypothetical protein